MLVRMANEAFVAQERALIYAQQHHDAWLAYRDDRLDRLEKALEMRDELYDERRAQEERARRNPNLPHAWTPSHQFLAALEDEADALRRGLALSDWYSVQTRSSADTGRPLFSLEELSPWTGEFKQEDAKHRPPIEGTLLERIDLVELLG